MLSKILILASVLLALANAQAPSRNVCANRQVGTFVRDVRQCQAYFFCSASGEALHAICPLGYLFDEATQKCHWPSRAQCFACPANTHFANVAVPKQCDQYIRCLEGVPEHRFCPSDLLFNAKIGKCDVPEKVQCEKTEPVPVCPAISDPARPVFIRDPEDCTRYSICENGAPSARQCPNQLHFNLKINQCDRPANAGCQPAGDPSFNCSAQKVLDPPLYAHPKDCRVYFACANGVANRLECPPETSWNQELQNCVAGSASCN